MSIGILQVFLSILRTPDRLRFNQCLHASGVAALVIAVHND